MPQAQVPHDEDAEALHDVLRERGISIEGSTIQKLVRLVVADHHEREDRRIHVVSEEVEEGVDLLNLSPPRPDADTPRNQSPPAPTSPSKLLQLPNSAPVIVPTKKLEATERPRVSSTVLDLRFLDLRIKEQGIGEREKELDQRDVDLRDQVRQGEGRALQLDQQDTLLKQQRTSHEEIDHRQKVREADLDSQEQALDEKERETPDAPRVLRSVQSSSRIELKYLISKQPT